MRNDEVDMQMDGWTYRQVGRQMDSQWAHRWRDAQVDSGLYR